MYIHDCKNYTSKIHTYYDGGFITRFLNNCYSFNGFHYLYTEKNINYTKLLPLKSVNFNFPTIMKQLYFHHFS